MKATQQTPKKMKLDKPKGAEKKKKGAAKEKKEKEEDPMAPSKEVEEAEKAKAAATADMPIAKRIISSFTSQS